MRFAEQSHLFVIHFNCPTLFIYKYIYIDMYLQIIMNRKENEMPAHWITVLTLISFKLYFQGWPKYKKKREKKKAINVNCMPGQHQSTPLHITLQLSLTALGLTAVQNEFDNYVTYTHTLSHTHTIVFTHTHTYKHMTITAPKPRPKNFWGHQIH